MKQYPLALLCMGIALSTTYAQDSEVTAVAIDEQLSNNADSAEKKEGAGAADNLQKLAQQLQAVGDNGLSLETQKELTQTLEGLLKNAHENPAELRSIMANALNPYRDAIVATAATGFLSYGSPRPIRFLKMMFVAGSIYGARQISEDGSRELHMLTAWWTTVKNKFLKKST